MVNQDVAAAGSLFALGEEEKLKKAMNEAISEIGNAWDTNTKVSDEVLPQLFQAYFQILDLPNLMKKSNFHELVKYVPEEEIAPEITEKLDAIASTAEAAKPRA